MRPFTSSITFKSTLCGWRVTYFDEDRNPLVSLCGESPAELNRKAQRLLSAMPEPIDAVLQATLWHGKRAYA